MGHQSQSSEINQHYPHIWLQLARRLYHIEKVAIYCSRTRHVAKWDMNALNRAERLFLWLLLFASWGLSLSRPHCQKVHNIPNPGFREGMLFLSLSIYGLGWVSLSSCKYHMTSKTQQASIPGRGPAHLAHAQLTSKLQGRFLDFIKNPHESPSFAKSG